AQRLANDTVFRFVDGRIDPAQADELDALWRLLGKARLLTVTRGMPTGSLALNAYVHGLTLERMTVSGRPEFVPGEPVMITADQRGAVRHPCGDHRGRQAGRAAPFRPREPAARPPLTAIFRAWQTPALTPSARKGSASPAGIACTRSSSTACVSCVAPPISTRWRFLRRNLASFQQINSSARSSLAGHG